MYFLIAGVEQYLVVQTPYLLLLIWPLWYILCCLLYREGGPTCWPISTLAAYVLGESYICTLDH